jgi:hypothetical protein
MVKCDLCLKEDSRTFPVMIVLERGREEKEVSAKNLCCECLMNIKEKLLQPKENIKPEVTYTKYGNPIGSFLKQYNLKLAE